MTGTVTQQTVAEPPTADGGEGLKKYYTSKNEELQLTVAEKTKIYGGYKLKEMSSMQK